MATVFYAHPLFQFPRNGIVFPEIDIGIRKNKPQIPEQPRQSVCTYAYDKM